jgi:hypothetical protein
MTFPCSDRRMSGERRPLLDAELTARGLQSYNAAQPRLRDNLKLPDWLQPRDIAYWQSPML